MLPYPMRIVWDTKLTVNKMQVHKDAASSLTKILMRFLELTDYQIFKKLGIDLFGGSYNFRQMRGRYRVECSQLGFSY